MEWRCRELEHFSEFGVIVIASAAKQYRAKTLEHRALDWAHRHREAALAAVAIQDNIGDLNLDCFGVLAMTAIPIERPVL